ncbi:MAG TPA: response regulator [Noviherbaspirillum sp.]|nr:response regulator [Noviherbaspirillum sp.]
MCRPTAQKVCAFRNIEFLYYMARILVVEDNPANMKLAVLILASAGHTVLQAMTAREGVALAMKEKPDIVLMDMQLPDMDGMEATRVLKSTLETAAIPVIAVTASAMKGDKERVLEVCDRYIEKPIDYKKLIAEVADICRAPGG